MGKSARRARPRLKCPSVAALTKSRNFRQAAVSSTSASRIIGDKNLNVCVGRDNFDELRFEYFRDATVATEAFKGDLVDWRTENSAKSWAMSYDFAAVGEKRVISGGVSHQQCQRYASVRL